MADRIQQRRDTAARWAEYNPVLLEGEMGIVTDNPNQYKIGDGVHAWNELPLRGFDGTVAQGIGIDPNTVMSQKAVSDNVGFIEYPIFNNSTSYSKGQVVNYEGRLKRFKVDHPAGDWVENEADNYSFRTETTHLRSIFNVNNYVNPQDTSTVYTLEQAINLVPEEERSLVKIVCFRSDQLESTIAVFTRPNYITGFTIPSNWDIIATRDGKVISDINTNFTKHVVFDVNSLYWQDTLKTFTLAEAIAAVPTEYRKIASAITFLKSDNTASIALFNRNGYVSLWEDEKNWYEINRNTMNDTYSLLLTTDSNYTRSNNIFNWRNFLKYQNLWNILNEATISFNKNAVLLDLGEVVSGDNVSFKFFITGTYEENGISDVRIITSETPISTSNLTYTDQGKYSPQNTRGYVTSTVNGYAYINILFTDFNEDKNYLDVLKTLVCFKGSSIRYPSAYIDYYQLNITEDSLSINLRNKINDKLDKNFGTSNAGKALFVGEDGNVIVSTSTPEGGMAGNIVERTDTTQVPLGPNLATSITVGKGWSNDSGIYTHTSGNEEPLTIEYETTVGTKYVLSLTLGSLQESAVWVTIGDYPEVDTYRGSTQVNIGFISQGGKPTIRAISGYNSTVSNIEFREVTSDSTEKTITVYGKNVAIDVASSDITSFWNVSIGDETTFQSTENSTRNIAIGRAALTNLKTGTRNVGVGTFALSNLVSGDHNVAIGSDALWYVSKASNNVAIGKASFGQMQLNLNAIRNVAIGESTLHGATTSAKENVAIGFNSASTTVISPSGNITIGAYSGGTAKNRCVIIGYLATATALDTTNSIAIGAGAHVTKSNQCVLGNDDITETKVYGDFIVTGSDGIVRKIIFNEGGTCSWETVE